LTPGEAIEIIVKRYQREGRQVRTSKGRTQCLFKNMQ